MHTSALKGPTTVTDHTTGAGLAPRGRTDEAIPADGSGCHVANWYSQWQRPLRGFIAGRHSTPSRDLDDVAQEVFLRLIRYDRAALIEQPQAYLFKMAANVAAEWAIRSRNTSAREFAWLAENSSDGSTDGGVSRLEAEEEVAQALLTLSPRYRKVLELQFFEGLSHAQTAQRLGVSERVVKRALAKSYQCLRQRLARS
jgi:RNA polymerase sigma factor (sigma-70 family)